MNSEKILFVDDEQNILTSFKRQFRKLYSVETAQSGQKGLETIASDGPFAVIVADMQMPEMTGIQFLTKAKDIAPDTVRMMLTGNQNQDTAMKAVNEGNIFRFLTKPCPPESLTKALEAGIEQYRLITAEKELKEKTLKGSIRVLIDLLSMIDPETFSCANRVRNNIKRVCEFLKIGNSWELELAAMLSPIGLTTIPIELRNKIRTGKELTSKEQDVANSLPEIGHRLISNIPRLENVAQIILYQNKLFNGEGVPHNNISGKNIPLGARVLKVVTDIDVFEISADSSFTDQSQALNDSRMLAFGQMKSRHGWYDSVILDAAIHALSPGAVDGDKVSVPMEISFKDLSIGDMLMSNVITSDNRMLLTAGNQISGTFLERLQNYANLVGIKEPILIRRVVYKKDHYAVK